MGGDAHLRNLDVLAGQYGIHQKSQSDPWPASLQATFRQVQKISLKNFSTYSNSVKFSPDAEPWKRENKARVEWLVKQASRLTQTTRNESSWRMSIENIVLDRFSLEVACPTCKNRLWRSEIEAVHTGSSRVWAELDQRRLNRQACTCPLTDRPQNRFELGTSRLFEDRVEEPVVYEHQDAELPIQKPDRIFGLRETNNLRILLERPPRFQSNAETRSLRDIVRCSPFKRQPDALLFPFLALEAKSDSAGMSFAFIQTQTALPIRLLLKLQKDLYSMRPSHEERPAPLVWFLAYKGNDWKLYGCYVDESLEASPIYNIHHLQGGDLTTNNGALRLLLLVDYITDWARDIFRPSVITQLSALASGRSYDDISLGPDSDIFSKIHIVNDWLSRAPSTHFPEEPTAFSRKRPIQAVFDDDIEEELPYTELGTIRNVSPVDQHVTGLRITEANILSLLALSDGPENDCHVIPHSKCARKLLNELARWDETLVVLGADLDYLERVWTNQQSTFDEPFGEGPEAEFYAIFEYRCFMNLSWTIVREFTYFAISKSAYNILVRHAAFQKRHKGLLALPRVSRRCPGELMRDMLDCLQSGSAWQVLHSALASTLMTIFPEPQKLRDDHMPQVEFLDFAYINSPRVGSLIEPFTKLADVSSWKGQRRLAAAAPNQKRFKAEAKAWDLKICDRSFRRIIQSSTQVPEASHDIYACSRCIGGKQDPFELKTWDKSNIPSPTAYDAVLVASIEEERHESDHKPGQGPHDLSLFAMDRSPWPKSNIAVATIVEDLAQSRMMYHTIRHDPKQKLIVAEWADEDPRVLWNLPFPYRKMTMRQEWEIGCWVKELGGKEVPDLLSSPFARSMAPWVHQQILLTFLREGMSYDSAMRALIKFRDAGVKSYDDTLPCQNGSTGYRLVAADCQSLLDFDRRDRPPSDGVAQGHSVPPLKIKLRGS